MQNSQFMFLLVLIGISILVLLVAVSSLRVANERERLVVFRLGKLLRVSGPGLSVVIPFVDRTIKVNVQQVIGWDGLSMEELEKRVVDIALRG